MRLALVAHGFPPHERTGVEVHTEALAAALARAGVEVHVFAPFVAPGLAPLSQRRETRGGYDVTWIALEEGVACDPLGGPRGIDAALRAFCERERVELVHFQHVAKIGARAIGVARELGLPIVYTAHDYTPLGPNPTLTLPNLEPQTDVSAEGYARWRSGRAYLDTITALGDHHGHALAEELEGEQRRELARRLSARAPDDGGRDAAEWQAWRALFRSCDRLFATSRFLAERLARELDVPVEPREAGIHRHALESVAPIDPRRKKLRFGFLGALLRPKGVHVLLEAFEALRGRAELVIHGDSRDERYVQALAARAPDCGARMAGGYSARELPAVLAGIDVLVVPSLWSENAPFVVREAFAARRPVLAARTEALAESVRDGIDGLLFEQGSAAALRDAMTSLIDDRELLGRLASGIRPVRDVDAEAREYASVYDELVASAGARAASGRQLPASVLPLAARHRALEVLPTRELCARAISGLGRLLSILGTPEEPGSFLAASLARGSRSRDQLDAAERRSAWLAESSRAAAEASESETRRADWLASQVRAREAHLASVSAEKQELEQARRSLAAERQWLAGLLAEREHELAWRERSARQASTALDEARAEIETLQRASDELRAELARARAELERERRAHETERRAHEEEREAHDCTRDALQDSEEEARWRAAEMEAARRAATTKLRARILGGELARRARQWPASPSGGGGEE